MLRSPPNSRNNASSIQPVPNCSGIGSSKQQHGATGNATSTQVKEAFDSTFSNSNKAASAEADFFSLDSVRDARAAATPMNYPRMPSTGKTVPAANNGNVSKNKVQSLTASLSSVHTDTTKEMTVRSETASCGGGSVTTHTSIDDDEENNEEDARAPPQPCEAADSAEDLLDILENASIDLNEQIQHAVPRLGSLSQNMTDERRKLLLHQSVTSRSSSAEASSTSRSSHHSRKPILHFEMEEDEEEDENDKDVQRKVARSPSMSNDSFDFSDVGWGTGSNKNHKSSLLPPPERQVQRNASFDNCSTVSELPFSMTKLQPRMKERYGGAETPTAIESMQLQQVPRPEVTRRKTLEDAFAASASTPPKTPQPYRGRNNRDHDDEDEDADGGAVSPLTVASALENSCGTHQRKPAVFAQSHCHGGIACVPLQEGESKVECGTADAPLIPPTSPEMSLRQESRRNRTVPLASPASRSSASPGGYLLHKRLQRSYGKLPDAALTDLEVAMEDQLDQEQEQQQQQQEQLATERPIVKSSKQRANDQVVKPGCAISSNRRVMVPQSATRGPAAPASSNGKVVRKIKVRAKDLASLVASQPGGVLGSGNASVGGGSVGASASPTTILNKVDLRKVQDAFRKIRSKTPTPTSRGAGKIGVTSNCSSRRDGRAGDDEAKSSVVPLASRSRSRSRRPELEGSSSNLAAKSSRSRSRVGSRRSLASTDEEGNQGLSARTESLVSEPSVSSPPRSRSRSRSRPTENVAAPTSSSNRSRSRGRPSDPVIGTSSKEGKERRHSHKERSRSRHRSSESSDVAIKARVPAPAEAELTGSPPSRRRERSSEVTSPTASRSFRGIKATAQENLAEAPTKTRSRSLAPVRTTKRDPEGSAARDSEAYPQEAACFPRTRSSSLAPRRIHNESTPSAMDSSEHQPITDRPPQAPASTRMYSPRLVLKPSLASSHTAMDASDHRSQADRPVSMPMRRASCGVPGALKSTNAPAAPSPVTSRPFANPTDLRASTARAPTAPEEDGRRRRSSSRKPPTDDEPRDEDRRRRSSSRKHSHKDAEESPRDHRHRSKSKGRSSGTCSALKTHHETRGRQELSTLPSSAHHNSIHNMIAEGHSSINSSVAAVVHFPPAPSKEPRRGVERTCSAVAREVGITKEQLQLLQSAGFQISSAQDR